MVHLKEDFWWAEPQRVHPVQAGDMFERRWLWLHRKSEIPLVVAIPEIVKASSSRCQRMLKWTDVGAGDQVCPTLQRQPRTSAKGHAIDHHWLFLTKCIDSSALWRPATRVPQRQVILRWPGWSMFAQPCLCTLCLFKQLVWLLCCPQVALQGV